MTTTRQPDILVFMSDQHNALLVEGQADPFIATPNIARLSAEGTTFNNAYTSCPLCVPARASMLTGQLPSRTGILTNGGVIESDHVTFAHSLGAAGYETVLCGRMHFLGPDQFRGFTKRLVGDFTPCYRGRYGAVRDDLGPYVETPSWNITKLYGGGTSPVLEYDRAVIEAALNYLSQPHDKPIFMLIGTYGPHHTFVAPPELYQKYLDLLPDDLGDLLEIPSLHPAMLKSTRDISPNEARKLRAAYYGMVEQIDSQIGSVYDAWQTYLQDNNREGVFCYLSDHGEQMGRKELWGKMSFYEDSARIPMVFTGKDVKPSVVVDTPVSIMDLGPTLCDLAEAPELPDLDGCSLHETLSSGQSDSKRAVFSEMLLRNIPARMVRYENWKYVSFTDMDDDDQLFDIDKDPQELENCIADHPEVAKKLKTMLLENWNPQRILDIQEAKKSHWEILSKWGAAVDVDEPYRWKIPESAWELPTP